MITIRDIQKRLKLMPESATVGKRYQYYLGRVESAISRGNPQEIMKLIETGIRDESNSFVLESMMNLYDALYLYGNEYNISTCARMIAEDYVAKLRDAKETQTNLKRKLGRIKASATTKANNNIEEISDKIKATIAKAQENLKANLGQIGQNVQSGLGLNKKEDPKKAKAKTEAFIRGYQLMITEATKCIYCDRILDNYEKVSKRYNVDRIIQENTRANGIDDTIASICRLVDTYNVSDKAKYTIAMETVWYGFKKNFIECPTSQYVTLITDYYMARGGDSQYTCSSLLEASMIVNRGDYQGDLEVIQEEEPEDNWLNPPEPDDDTTPLNHMTEMHIQDQIRNQTMGTHEIDRIKLNEAADFNKIFSDFKKSPDEHKETKLQWLVRKLYTKNPSDIIEGTPSLFNYIRLIFILGAFTLNPIIGAVNLIADIFISLHCKREEAKAMIECYKKEIDLSKKKMNLSNDPTEKARLKKYIDELEKGMEKINEYYEAKLTDEELDRKYEEDDSSDDDDDFDMGDDSEGGDDDDDWGDFDDDNFMESTIIALSSFYEQYANLPIKEVDRSTIDELMDTYREAALDLVPIAKYFPDIVDPAMLEAAINTRLRNRQPNTSSMAIYNLNSAKASLKYDKVNYPTPVKYSEHVADLWARTNILEAVNDIKNACDYYHPLIEGSFTNSIAMASQKLKRTLQNLSDKEREVSKNIDVSANNAKKAMEKALTTDNRESVIKGSVLPSASKCIKLGITMAGLCFIDPVIAVIGALGYIGMSKSYKAKERQMVLDEIEIELKMCEKYIEIAESKNDMKALKKLLTIQRELERQRQRIKYNMQVKMGQKYYSASTTTADSSME